jgi:DNA polymerase I
MPYRRLRLDYEGDYVVLDFETTNLDKGDALNPSNHIVMASWYRSWDGVRSSVYANEYGLGDLLLDLERCSFIVAHNAKFELQWLGRCGYLLGAHPVYDTMLGDYVIAGNRRFDLTLDGVAKRYELGHKESVVNKLIKGGCCPSEIPRSMLIAYCEQDVELCRRIFLRQIKDLRKAKLLHIQATRCLTTLALADIEMQGMPLGCKDVTTEFAKVDSRYAELQAKLDAISGGLNWDSPKQIGAYLYGALGFREPTRRDGELDRTDSGQPRTDEATILKLRASRQDQKEFLEVYREFVPLKKQKQTLEKFKACCEEDGGVLFGKMNQAVTQTHRLSSSGKKHKIQFQNIDRNFKRFCVSNHDDYLICEADGVQLEFRAAIQLGQDLVGLQDVYAKKDIHKFSGSVIFGIPESEVVGEKRTEAKPYTFKPLYGGNSGTPAELAYYAAFRERYGGVFATQTKWTYDVLRDGSLRTPYGIIFYWPDVKISRSGYISNTPSIFNYPVQGFATSEIIPISLFHLWFRMKETCPKSRLINTVHDSVVVMVHKDEINQLTEACRQAFTVDVYKFLWEHYGIKMFVPLGTEIKIGKHWGDGSVHKETYELDPREVLSDDQLKQLIGD